MASPTWPDLPTVDWQPTLATLHRWTQVIGKIRLVQSPWLNHSWNVALYVTPVGLTTGTVPHGDEAFELTMDLRNKRMVAIRSHGEPAWFDLKDGMSVAEFYERTLKLMDKIEMPVSIYTTPSEIADAVPFPDDHENATFDHDHARALHRVLLSTNGVFERFRSGYLGKASRVHFFWGSFDLAVTRFSGRTAPPHPGGLPNFPVDVAAEAYSHEVTSVGFWPGDAETEPIFYAYAYPSPDGFADATVGPEGAFWLDALGEFVLPYSAVAAADDPADALLTFCESTHAAAADLAEWDREALECDHPHGPDWWVNRPHAPAEATGPAEQPEQAGAPVVETHHDEAGSRFVVTVDGVERGFTVYRHRGGRWIFVHTEIDDSVGGLGLGSAVVRFALDHIRTTGEPVVPLCPFVAGWIERHPEYADLVDQERLAMLSER
ncbi:MAG: DUF5996 family protein [Actinomycetota bacterium]